MPVLKTQDEKAASTIKLQPKNMDRSNIQLIMMYDLMGWTVNSIANEVGLTISRVSIIRTSPLYLQQITLRREQLHRKIIEQRGSRIVEGDPVKKVLEKASMNAAEGLIAEMFDAKSEGIKHSAKKEILDRTGYGAKTKTTIKSIEVTESMAGRFESCLEGKEPTRTVTIVEKEIE